MEVGSILQASFGITGANLGCFTSGIRRWENELALNSPKAASSLDKTATIMCGSGGK